MYNTILLDLDDTLLDFGAAEQVAIRRTFSRLGIAPADDLIHRYVEINQLQWEAMERGEITRERLLVRRFELLFEERGIGQDAAEAENIYSGYLGIGHYFIEGAVELLDYLSPKYDLYLASNGVAATQASRLKSAGIGRYFREIFISETTGHHKPEREYFDYCFARIRDFSPERTLMIGDSLSGDILGGRNAGIRTCWFNPQGKPRRDNITPDYEIRALRELRDIL